MFLYRNKLAKTKPLNFFIETKNTTIHVISQISKKGWKEECPSLGGR